MSLCSSGKVPFDSRKQLKRYLRSKGLQRNRIYQCPSCAYFHHSSANHRVTTWYRERA